MENLKEYSKTKLNLNIMEVNTVVISLDRLKELELAEKKVNEPRSNTIIILSGYGEGSEYTYRIETDDECTKK